MKWFPKKYFNFEYSKFLIPMIKEGICRFESFDENKDLIITTTFYIDGDAMTELYVKDDRLLAEFNKEKVDLHMKNVEEKAGSVDVLFVQIQSTLTVSISSVTLYFSSIEYGLLLGAGATFGIGAILLLLKKYVMVIVVWIAKKIVIPLSNKAIKN